MYEQEHMKEMRFYHDAVLADLRATMIVDSRNRFNVTHRPSDETAVVELLKELDAKRDEQLWWVCRLNGIAATFEDLNADTTLAFNGRQRLEERPIEVSYTANPRYGRNAPQIPLADKDEFFIEVLLCTGGPAYLLRARIDLATRGVKELAFVYQPWGASYEMQVAEPNVWREFLFVVANPNRLSNGDLWRSMKRNGNKTCPVCNTWLASAWDGELCPACGAAAFPGEW